MTLEKELSMQLNKHREKPDTYIGLLKQGRILKYVKNLQKGSRVRMTPFKKPGTGSVFPFLISEAKSATSSKNASAIELQIFFQLMETLLAQNSLATKRDGGFAAFEPLVWGLTYTGESIHIIAACLRWEQPVGSSNGYYCTVGFNTFPYCLAIILHD